MQLGNAKIAVFNQNAIVAIPVCEWSDLSYCYCGQNKIITPDFLSKARPLRRMWTSYKVGGSLLVS